MDARDINRLVFERIKSSQDLFKIFLDVLDKVGGRLEKTAEKTSLLELLKVLCRESQRAGNAACR